MIDAGSMINMDVVSYLTVQEDRATVGGLNLVGLKREKNETC
jgi:acyl-[acyl carrier protein]--UDP-N-acetylglucosamine O-acyltransferase